MIWSIIRKWLLLISGLRLKPTYLKPGRTSPSGMMYNYIDNTLLLPLGNDKYAIQFCTICISKFLY